MNVISIVNELQKYLSHIAREHRYPGLPPSVLYSRFDTQCEYLRCLLDPMPELVALLKLVLILVRYLAAHVTV